MTKSIYPVLTKQKTLPFYISGIGVTDPEYHVYRNEGLVSHQFLFTTDGEGVLKIKGKIFRLKKGDFLYIPPYVPHEYFPLNNNWKTSWCVFRGNYISELMQALGFVDFQIKKMDNSSKIPVLFTTLFKLSENSDSYEKVSQFLYEYILTVKHFLFDAEINMENSKIKSCLKYIDLNYRNDITDEELSKVSGCSIQYLCRIFKKTMGIRPLEFIARKRISEAKNLLDSTNMSLTEISSCLGFKSLNYFGMVFKKYEGISATEYREKGYLKDI